MFSSQRPSTGSVSPSWNSLASKSVQSVINQAPALFWEGNRLHKYIFGLRVLIVTDHQALQFLFNPNKSVAKSTVTMIERWSIASRHTTTTLSIDRAKRSNKPTYFPGTQIFLRQDSAISSHRVHWCRETTCINSQNVTNLQLRRQLRKDNNQR